MRLPNKPNLQSHTSKHTVSIDGIRQKQKPLKKSDGLLASTPKVKIRIHTVQNQRVPKHEASSKPIHPYKAKSSGKGVKISILTSSIVLGVAFIAGMLVMRTTDKSFAVETEVRGETVSVPPGSIVMMEADPPPQEIQQGTQNLLTMTIEQLENYLTSQDVSSPDPEQLKLQKRIDFLKVYLRGKKSPLLEYAETIANLKHWKVVLAISNSESSLGKKCADNNCSGIGVEPGHSLWRKYSNKGEWAKDLDKLLEKRYKDWTLEEMNGTYNYPGSENWVFAANQILQDLKGVE